MNPFHIAATFVRTTAQRATEGANPPNQRFDEWEIYQRDLELSKMHSGTSSNDARAFTTTLDPIMLVKKLKSRP